MLTHDPVQAQSYDDDELITKNIGVNVLLGLHDLSTRIIADAGAITVPTLVLSAGSDWVVKNVAQRTFYEGLSSTVKEMEVYPDFYHAILCEKDRELAIAQRHSRSVIGRSQPDATCRKKGSSILFPADAGGV